MPTEHATMTGEDAADLPEGSVLISADVEYPDPIVRRRAATDGWTEGNGVYFRLGGSRYLVLYVPPVRQPAIGDTLTLAQLEALPVGAGVVDPFNTIWQAVVRLNDDGSELSWARTTSDMRVRSSKLAATYSALTLVWLPPTEDETS